MLKRYTPSRLPALSRGAGFTLVEAVMVILLLAALSMMSISTITDSLNEARFNATLTKLNELRDAMIGNPNIRVAGLRTHYGFLGDIGALPTTIGALTTKPGGWPNYAIDATARIGVGWNGPYLVTGQPGVSYTTDAWGEPIVYDTGATPPTLTSTGANKAAGGTGYNSDIVVELPATLRVATVDGFLSNADGTPYTGTADVVLSYPNGSGAITTSTVNVVALDAGHFSFSNIPFGIRSLTAYKPNSGAPTNTIANIIVHVDNANVLVQGSELKWP